MLRETNRKSSVIRFKGGGFGGSPAGPEITPTVTPSNTVTPSITPSNTVTPSVTLTSTPTPTPTPTLTQTYTPSVTPSNTVASSLTPTSTPTPTPTPTVTTSVAINPNVFNVSAAGSSSYVINGQNNPTLNLVTGSHYTFNVNAAGHPFYIQIIPSPYSSGSVYNTGVTNNGTSNGTLTLSVSAGAPSTLFYVCGNHSSMTGFINIT